MVERVSSALTRLVEQQGMDPLVFGKLFTFYCVISLLSINPTTLSIVFKDPLNMPFEMVRIPLPFMSDPEKEAPEWLLEANNEIQNAAGFIVISAEYNCGVPPALANMLDHFSPDSFRHRPCGIVTYSMGPRGGIRAQVVLRPMLSELKMISTPYAVHLAEVHDAISEDGTIVTERIHNEFVRLVKEVEWYADAMRKQRECVAPPE